MGVREDLTARKHFSARKKPWEEFFDRGRKKKNHELRVLVLFVSYSTIFKYMTYPTKQCAKENSFVIFLILGLENTAFYLKVIDI